MRVTKGNTLGASCPEAGTLGGGWGVGAPTKTFFKFFAKKHLAPLTGGEKQLFPAISIPEI